jgi:hypothetical protein
MVKDRLRKEVLRRLNELGLPPSVIDLGEFRDNFFSRGWVMFVRDRDDVANVHLVQPRQQGIKSARRR